MLIVIKVLKLKLVVTKYLQWTRIYFSQNVLLNPHLIHGKLYCYYYYYYYFHFEDEKLKA